MEATECNNALLLALNDVCPFWNYSICIHNEHMCDCHKRSGVPCIDMKDLGCKLKLTIGYVVRTTVKLPSLYIWAVNVKYCPTT